MFVKIAAILFFVKDRMFVIHAMAVCAISAIGIYVTLALNIFVKTKRGFRMPILTENKKRYPENWKEIRTAILVECGNKCEFCGVKNHTLRNGKKIVLTIAHLDHTHENCARENLRALCQKCHNRHDAKHRAQTRKRRFAAGQLNLFELEAQNG
jgi:hypothetical protein